MQWFHYWVLFVIAAATWWIMLTILFSLWASEGFPNYVYAYKPDQSVLYISDVGAGQFKPIFVVGCCLQAACFAVGSCADVYLRLIGLLKRHSQQWVLVSLYLSLTFAFVAQVGIVCVAILDNVQYHEVHASLLIVFMVFLGFSAIFNVAATGAMYREQQPTKDHWHYRLKTSLSFKVVWLTVELVLALAFVTTQSFFENSPAVLEWIISLLYPFYALILAWDLWPARKGLSDNALPACWYIAHDRMEEPPRPRHQHRHRQSSVPTNSDLESDAQSDDAESDDARSDTVPTYRSRTPPPPYTASKLEEEPQGEL